MKMNYMFKVWVAAMLLLASAAVNAKDVTVSGTDRNAFNAAWGQVENGDTISIAENITWDDDQFGISKGIVIRGVGENIEIRAAGDYKKRMFNFEATGLKIENLTFCGAYIDGSTGGETDGAIGRLLSGVITFKDCTFKDNYAADRSGAVSVQGGVQATFENCKFINNKANRGGAIWFAGDATVANFYNCEFIDNNAAGERGGAFYLENSPTINVYNSLFKGNSAGTKTENPDGSVTFTGNGGGVFKTSGSSPKLSIYSSSIIENNCYGDHGGVLTADGGTPTISFVNTTIAKNRMWKDSNSMFFLAGVVNLSMINVTMVGNYGNPNTGNTTGISIREVGSNVKIYNSIIAGNTANNGAAVDLNIRDAVANSDAGVAGVLEIKNSIVGFIKGITGEQAATITGFATSKINEYSEGQNWRDTEVSGIAWLPVAGDYSNNPPVALQYEGVQGYVPISYDGFAAKLGDPALLAAALDVEESALTDQIGVAREEATISAGAIEAVDPLVNDDKPDLIITELTLTPADPDLGDQVTFEAVIKNIGEAATPENVKHGVAFSVNGTLVSWSDTHTASLGVDEEVRLTATGGPNDVAYWVATGGPFEITAEVNDQQDIEESDYSNNTLSRNITITGMKNVVAAGRLFTQDGALHIAGYATESVVIYNVLGQKIATYHAISDNLKVNLPAGTYVVLVRDNAHKVLVK
jgi:hypothetical protein